MPSPRTTVTIPQEHDETLFPSTTLATEDYSLVVTSGPEQGRSFALEQEIMHIGRADWCDIVLDKDLGVSSQHCKIQLTPKGVRVTDFGSRNGVFIEGQEILDAYLAPEATLKIGTTTLKLLTQRNPKQLQVNHHDKSGLLIGKSQRMRELFAVLSRLASRDVSVLITGETGTGKSQFARAIHLQSDRANQPFIQLNCGALAAGTIASELFGHEKGAFTDAKQRHFGAFEQADGGVLFLDEIGELPLEQQKLLLTVLDQKSIRRLGSQHEVDVDFRLIAATNRELLQARDEGTFREDLYYRLSVVHLHIPPLRERPEDIPLLANAFLKRHARGEQARLTPQAYRKLQRYTWPGNVRELHNSIERAMVFCEDDLIDAEDIYFATEEEPSVLQSSGPSTSALEPDASASISDDLAAGLSLKEILENTERVAIAEALEISEGNVSKTAKLLQISRGWLYKKLDKYNAQ